jgi:hypothetical protein
VTRAFVPVAEVGLNRFVVVLGDNPFAERDIVVLLRDLNIKAVSTPRTGDSAPVFQHKERIVVCVGQSHALETSIRRVRVPHGWRNAEHVSTNFVQIRRNDSTAECCCQRSEDIKLCGQENFFAWLVTGHEPSDTNAMVIREYQESFLFKDTALLDEMSVTAFPWPGTDATPAADATDSFTPEYQEGLLSHFGYRVGRRGVPIETRRDILEQTFLATTLPQVNSFEYLAEWGDADSAARLKKMAHVIAALCRNAKRQKTADLSASISEWQSDLDWLKSRFYTGRFDQSFGWPNT